MFLLNEIVEIDTDIGIYMREYLTAYQEIFDKKDFLFSLKKGDIVCLSDAALSIFRNSTIIDEYVDPERQISTLLKNVNRRGYIKSIKKKNLKRKGGRIEKISVFIVIGFDDGSQVSIGNPRLIRKID